MAIRAKEAGEILGVSAVTVRTWCDKGLLPHKLSASGQRIFNREELEAFYRARLGLAPAPTEYWYYTRSSDGSDILLSTQEEKLKAAHGAPARIYKDKASGLNEARKGLNKLLEDLKASDHPVTICVTNKDRLSRFGVKYLDLLIQAYGGTLEVLDSDETKEPHEVLMQDFMSLIASFSGKFYRLRGHAQKKQLLEKALEEVKARE